MKSAPRATPRKISRFKSTEHEIETLYRTAGDMLAALKMARTNLLAAGYGVKTVSAAIAAAEKAGVKAEG